MKKILFALTLAATLVTNAGESDYMLFWQIGSGYFTEHVDSLASANVAKLYATLSGGNAVEVADAVYSTGGSTAISAISAQKADLSGLADSTIAGFYVEFYNYTGENAYTTLGSTLTSSYSEILAAGAITDYRDGKDIVTGSAQNAWSFSGFSQIPEPTSGLLMLLGLAGLALKRKIG